MSHHKFNKLFALVIVTLLSFSAVVQAAPLGQEGEAGVDDGQQEDSQEGNGHSLGDTLDMTKSGYNLGTIMSGKNQTAGDETDDDDDGTDDDDDGEADDDDDGEADDDDDDNGEADDDDDGTEDDDDDGGVDDSRRLHPVANAIAIFFDKSYEEVFGLHQDGNGFGNITKAYFFSDKIGMSPGELLEEAHGSGWGNVLKQNGIHPGAVGRGVGRNSPSDTEQESGVGATDFAGPGNSGNRAANNPGLGNGQGNRGANGQATGVGNGNGKAKGKDKDKKDNRGKAKGHGKKK